MSNLQVYAATAGSQPVQSLRLGYVADPSALYAPVAVADPAATVAYPTVWLTDADGDYVVVAAWAALIAAVLVAHPAAIVGAGYYDGAATIWGPMIRPTAQADYECVVSGVLDDGWRSGAYHVTAALDALVSAGVEQYPATGYTATVGTSGAWSLILPRGAVATFRFPGERVGSVRTIPDAANVAWGALVAPA